MNHFKHPLCNTVLRAAEGDEDTVDDLHIQRGTLEGGFCVRSFWKPDATELLCLNAGAPVVLSVLGMTHPPLRLCVPNPDEGFPELPTFEHDEKLLDDLVDAGGLTLNTEIIKDIAKTYAMQILRRYGK